MKKNMSMIDRLLRAAIAIAVVVLYFSGQLTGTAAVILGILAVIFLGTSIAGFCPVYKVLGISTLKVEGADEGHPGGAHHKGAH
ncbi:MAG: YgaP family membrane protein [Nitrospirota bacterium]